MNKTRNMIVHLQSGVCDHHHWIKRAQRHLKSGLLRSEVVEELTMELLARYNGIIQEGQAAGVDWGRIAAHYVNLARPRKID